MGALADHTLRASGCSLHVVDVANAILPFIISFSPSNSFIAPPVPPSGPSGGGEFSNLCGAKLFSPTGEEGAAIGALQADLRAIDDRWAPPADALEHQVPAPQAALPVGPWNDLLPAAAPPSGCDSSSCTYCQGMVSRRRLPGSSVCWLRRKRSESELATMGAGAGQQTQPGASPGPSDGPQAVPDVDYYGAKQPDSIWNHALLETAEASAAINARLSSHKNSLSANFDAAWSWKDEYLARPDPAPSSLVEIASFKPLRPSCVGGPCPPVADIACGIEFEEHGWLLATAGVSKQVRVYSLASYLAESSGNAVPMPRRFRDPLVVHRLASKLSSLAWNPDQPGVVTVGDYDGVVTQLDLESGHLVAEVDEHAGRRVWDVSHSHLRPHLAASGSEDGTVALWAGPGLATAAARLRPGAAVTGVQLSPYDENAIAVACADSRAHVYDLRRLDAPLVTLAGHHTRPASYAKFLDRTTLVTAATDATLATWTLGGDLSSSIAPGRVFQGHANCKNFVGLAVRPEDRLVACGSECSRVYAYSMAWERPVASADLGVCGCGGCGAAAAPGLFCTAVTWQPEGAAPGCGPLLAAATSDGGVKILGLRQI